MKKNQWHQLESHPEVFVGQYIVPNFMSNSIALKVSEKEWVVISPGKSLLDSWGDICGFPDISLSIVLPNGFHYMGVQAWLDKFPHASLYASEKAIKRLSKQGFQQINALEHQLPALPLKYQILIPPGHRGGDVWVCKQDSENGGLWITCDSFQNYERYSNQPIARALQKLLDTAPGLKMSQVVKWLLIDHKRNFKEWVLKQLDADKPTTLIPSHGEVEEDGGLYSRLEKLINSRL